MLHSGLSLPFSLAILHERQKEGLLKDTLEQVSADLEGGSSLNDAFKRHPKLFDEMCLETVRAGERNSNLGDAFTRLANFLEAREAVSAKARKNFRQTLLGAFIGYNILAYFSTIVYPVFSETLIGIMYLFGDSQMTAMQDIIRVIIILLFILLYGAMAAIIGVNVAFRTKLSRRIPHQLLFMLPGVGKVIRKTAVAQFSRSLGQLLSCGAPAAEAVRIAGTQVRNQAAAKAFDNLCEKVQNGESLPKTLIDSELFSPLISSMIHPEAAPETLGPALVKIAEFSESDAEFQVYQIQRGLLVAAISFVVIFVISSGAFSYLQERWSASGCGSGG
jgi:type IV pilus assembly protein PilC